MPAIHSIALMNLLLVDHWYIRGINYQYFPTNLAEFAKCRVPTAASFVTTFHPVTWKMFIDIPDQLIGRRIHRKCLMIEKICTKINRPTFLVYINTYVQLW